MLAPVRWLLVLIGLSGMSSLAAIGLAQATPEPAPDRASEDGPRRVTIAGSGDLLLHIKVNQAARDHDWDHVFSGLREATEAGDVTFANLETPLVDDVIDVRTGSPPVLGASGDVAGALARAGVDVLGCANNHAYDQGAHGLSRTLDLVRAANVVAVGADEDEAAAFRHRIVEHQGLRIAFLAYSERINRGPGPRPPMTYVANLRGRNEPRLLEAIAAARADADLVVLGIHWSHDFVATPRHGQRRKAQAWVDAGVDLILGTGPHVLQSVERLTSPRGEAVVAYSLGNLVSNQGNRYRVGKRVSEKLHRALRLPGTRDAVLLRAEAVVEGGRVSFPALEGRAMWVHNNFFDRRYRRVRDFDIHIQPLSATPEEVRAERLPAIQETLGEAVQVTP